MLCTIKVDVLLDNHHGGRWPTVNITRYSCLVERVCKYIRLSLLRQITFTVYVLIVLTHVQYVRVQMQRPIYAWTKLRTLDTHMHVLAQLSTHIRGQVRLGHGEVDRGGSRGAGVAVSRQGWAPAQVRVSPLRDQASLAPLQVQSHQGERCTRSQWLWVSSHTRASRSLPVARRR